ncbi:hypothetical protein L9F63_025119, partial [Diploptera punctata]
SVSIGDSCNSGGVLLSSVTVISRHYYKIRFRPSLHELLSATYLSPLRIQIISAN